MNQHLAQYGVFIGGIAVAISHLMFWTEMDNSISQYVIYTIIIVGLLLSLNHYRDSALGGFMEYGKSVGTGVVITLLFSVILAFYQYFLFKFNPEVITKLMDETVQELYKSGASEKEIDNMLEITESVLSPGMLGISSFFSHAITGSIFTLVISFFTKRNNPNPFNNVEGNIS